MTRVKLSSGISLNVEVQGEGPPLVLLHGFTGSAGAWGPFLDLLTRDFSTIAVDMVGHGASDSPTDVAAYAMPRVVSDLLEVATGHDAGRAHWLGYSMGGRAALQVAAAHPEAVDRLVLIGASPGLATDAERAERRASDAALARRINEEGVARFVEYWEAIPLFASQRTLPAEVQARVRAARTANTAAGLQNSLLGMGTGSQEPLHDKLASIGCPSLLLAGELDPKYCAIARDMAEAMPAARFVEVPGAGHATHIEKPALCADLVRSALVEQEATA